jgi:peptidoglycan/LPS O-acetylase OafA/YrhL
VVALFSRVGMDATAGLGFPRCIAGFMLGAALRLSWGALRGADRAIGRFGTWLECVSLLLVVAFIVLLERTWMVFLAPLVFCLPVYLFACETGAISRFLKRAPFQSVGQWSYSIYMVHAPFILIATQVAKAAGKYLGLATFVTIHHGSEPETLMSFASPAAMDGVALVFCAVIVTMAALCHRFVELPWQTRLNRLWSGKATPGPSLSEPDGAPRIEPRITARTAGAQRSPLLAASGGWPITRP